LMLTDLNERTLKLMIAIAQLLTTFKRFARGWNGSPALEQCKATSVRPRFYGT
jgi:hypothetical protein